MLVKEHLNGEFFREKHEFTIKAHSDLKVEIKESTQVK